ncbi:MAG: hypothetical protein ACI4IL_01935 [Eubacterium sp.]
MKITENTIKRALRTFIQSAIAYITVNAVCINFSETEGGVKSALIGLAVSAVSAGIAGVMNMERVDK